MIDLTDLLHFLWSFDRLRVTQNQQKVFTAFFIQPFKQGQCLTVQDKNGLIFF